MLPLAAAVLIIGIDGTISTAPPDALPTREEVLSAMQFVGVPAYARFPYFAVVDQAKLNELNTAEYTKVYKREPIALYFSDYRNGARIILADDWRKGPAHGMTVLVHEMRHYKQTLDGTDGDSTRNECDAYQTESWYEISHGYSSATATDWMLLLGCYSRAELVPILLIPPKPKKIPR